MVLLGISITLRLHGVFSLKDKRRIVKSIVERNRSRHNVSSAEIDLHDILNQTVIGFGIVSGDYTIARKKLDQLLDQLEDNYPVEILEHRWWNGVMQ
ncbi:MAG: DUF503 domain-containing protein [Fastidiosipilaceae bacterium]|jgi:uncharacterized protein YlxP (DUF503 family)|nr:DUF503 domain-containing protein [Clostridiaceae bacterium]